MYRLITCDLQAFLADYPDTIKGNLATALCVVRVVCIMVVCCIVKVLCHILA